MYSSIVPDALLGEYIENHGSAVVKIRSDHNVIYMCFLGYGHPSHFRNLTIHIHVCGNRTVAIVGICEYY